jgi:hypothetical protein
MRNMRIKRNKRTKRTKSARYHNSPLLRFRIGALVIRPWLRFLILMYRVQGDLRAGDRWLQRYYGVVKPSMAFTNNDVEKR